MGTNIKTLARSIDAKSAWTAGHSERAAKLALALSDTLNIDPKERENLYRVALLHDIGKIRVQASILNKPGKLNEQENEIIKNHPQKGAQTLEPIKEYKALLPIVLQHHERFDGEGYPEGLSGNSIHFGARILSVADASDTMKSDRPYREGRPLDRVIGKIQSESGLHFDPVVVEAFMNTIYNRNSKAA